MTNRSRLLDELNATYTRLHTAKEDAFWVSYMGLSDDADAARADLDARDIEVKRFLSDPARLRAAREALEAAERADAEGGAGEEELIALRGWLRTFEAHGIESDEARALEEELVGDEGALARARGAMQLGYVDPEAGFQTASSVRLSVTVGTDEDPARRQAAWEGLRSIETFVLENGYVELVRKRNRLARMLGAEDYYDWRCRRGEGSSKAEVFELLDELEVKTRESARRAIDALVAEHGQERVTPAQVRFLTTGDSTRELDPYFPFELAIDRWVRSFAALGIDYRGAELVLDLIDRKGKYENGFMHGPEIAWRDRGELRPARIHFTANAIPGMVGSGKRALETLFHEGGHAAHFANVDMPAPCFGQEFAPTSASMAETQSMFLDSLISDADWRARYARTLAGDALPWELVQSDVEKTQPFAAWDLRWLVSVCYAERAIYEIPDEELSAERILEVLRASERRLVLLDEGSPRPTLSIPHLLSGEAAGTYHGYVLAEMAVRQTRDFFLRRDGHLVDNPRIGPALRDAYWRPGNSRTFKEFVHALTGAPLSADHLARHVNRTSEEALSDARRAWEAEPAIPRHAGSLDLGGSIRVADGNETVTRAGSGAGEDFERLAAEFASWIAARTSAQA